MSLEGKKGLKSICKSWGKANTHDSIHKAGKVIVAKLIETGGKLGAVDLDAAEEEEDEMGDEFMIQDK